MISINHLYGPITESWDYFSRTLFIHKLEKPNGNHTLETLEKLKDLDIIYNINDVYIYSFIHPDNNLVTSFTGSSNVMKKKNTKLWMTFSNPLRGFLYKGSASDRISTEKIHSEFFNTQTFLFTGEQNKLKKIDEIKCKAISTTVPISTPIGVAIYENIRMKNFEENQFDINHIKIKKFKAISLPQMAFKSNYVYIYKCETN